MPARARRHLLAFSGYLCVSILFYWPIPLHPASTLPGAPGGDTGVYVWNLWVFRHEIVVHGRFPFFTSEILSPTSGTSVPLTLHNYTTAANLIAFPVLPALGVVATFNVLMMLSVAVAAYTAFLFLRARVQDDAAAWVGGLLFGFSPYMMARQMAHFSLVQAAALPAFALVLYRFRLRQRPSYRRAVLAGGLVAWAFLSDPYYAVYCLLMALYLLGWEIWTIEGRCAQSPFVVRAALNGAIVCFAGLVVGIILSGGGRPELFGLRVSMTRLYTPVLLLTLTTAARVWLGLRPRITWQFTPVRKYAAAAAIAGASCVVFLSPVLSAIGTHLREERWIAPRVWWRSSAPGVDLLAFFVPNPVGSLFGWVASGWLSRMPDGLYENVASIPWTATFTFVLALLYRRLRPPRYWVIFTALTALLALGPFVHVAGMNTHIPTPWALLRYVPVIGAARMPTRLTVLVMLGASVLLAAALHAFRRHSAHPWVPPVVVSVLLLVELAPSPRPVYPARVPDFVAIIAADPRPVRVLHLPFGLRDGLSSAGDFTAYAQFLQTFHEKPLVGGYISRLPSHRVESYRQLRFFRLLLDLSERRHVSASRMEKGIEAAHAEAPGLNIGYVIVDTGRASAQLVSFASSALNLQQIATDGTQALYIVR